MLLIEGVGEMHGGVGWGGWSGVEKFSFRTSHKQPQWPITYQWATVSAWEQTQVPTAQLASSISAIVPVVALEGRQNVLEKSRPVNI